jgi:hypothetical protein
MQIIIRDQVKSLKIYTRNVEAVLKDSYSKKRRISKAKMRWREGHFRWRGQ